MNSDLAMNLFLVGVALAICFAVGVFTRSDFGNEQQQSNEELSTSMLAQLEEDEAPMSIALMLFRAFAVIGAFVLFLLSTVNLFRSIP